MGLGIVPRTEIIYLASPVFSYKKSQLHASRGRFKPLPPKIGSFQLFVHGYMDASAFFCKGYERLRRISQEALNSSEKVQDINDDADNWSDSEKHKFRILFERMVVLDYLIRQTDRSMDNWMIKDSADDSNEKNIRYVLLLEFQA